MTSSCPNSISLPLTGSQDAMLTLGPHLPAGKGTGLLECQKERDGRRGRRSAFLPGSLLPLRQAAICAVTALPSPDPDSSPVPCRVQGTDSPSTLPPERLASLCECPRQPGREGCGEPSTALAAQFSRELRLCFVGAYTPRN